MHFHSLYKGNKIISSNTPYLNQNVSFKKATQKIAIETYWDLQKTEPPI